MRVHGEYGCDHPGCDKHFSRPDHLSRHKRNHDPSKRYDCLWPSCVQTFTRSDVRDTHYKRHLVKSDTSEGSANGSVEEESPQDQRPVLDPLYLIDEKQYVASLGHTKTVRANVACTACRASKLKCTITEGEVSCRRCQQLGHTCTFALTDLQARRKDTHVVGPRNTDTSHVFGGISDLTLLQKTLVLSFERLLYGAAENGLPSAPLLDVSPQNTFSAKPGTPDMHRKPPAQVYPPFTDNAVPMASSKPPTPSNSLHPRSANTDAFIEGPEKPLSPSDLIEWLFHEDRNISHDTRDQPRNVRSNRQSMDLANGFSPISLLESMFAVLPNFPTAYDRKNIDEGIRQKLLACIPSLATSSDFEIVQIERCLEIYWLIYHPQYPILHRPSFSNGEAQPLLLLAMIMLGASLSSCTGVPETLFANPKGLADQIADPLRWLIFANKDCKPPAKVWVVQSLLLLETYEITSTSRLLHERAYLHHGSKIQLLRRSPILGGDPLKDESEDGAYLPPNHVWKKWIEVESMKRATLMAFYLDTVHATVYGHMIILYAHQIKLSLPCEDELWDFDNTNQKSESLSVARTPKFLEALKKLLHREKVHTSAFGKKILLAGLLTIMFQMQQKDLQLSFLEWDAVKESWQRTISLAIDVWRIDICSKGGCCATETSLCFPQEDLKVLPPMLRLDDKRCKFGLYHIAQIFMRITHYDYIIYAGAPSRMNVIAGDNEYKVVEKRVKVWANSLHGRISVIHAYLFLCEMMLAPENEDITYLYDPNIDPFLHRKNIVASAVLVIFAYNFSLYGQESDMFENGLVSSDYYPDREDGYAYLRRIRRELSKHERFHRSDYGDDSGWYHNFIKGFADMLLLVDNTHHIVGLLKLFYKAFKDCKWEIGVEYANLFKNCIERCLGRKKVTCDGMYLNYLT